MIVCSSYLVVPLPFSHIWRFHPHIVQFQHHMWQFFSHIWWFPYFFLIFDGFILTLCSSNITFDSSFLTFSGSLIFFSCLTFLLSHHAVPISHLTVLLSHIVVLLFFFLKFDSSIVTLSSTNIASDSTFALWQFFCHIGWFLYFFFSHLTVSSSHYVVLTSHVYHFLININVQN